MKRLQKILSSKANLVFLAMLLQLAILVGGLIAFMDSFYIFYSLSIVLSFAVVLWILNDTSNPAYKIAWLISILVFPIFGGIFYLFFGKIRLSGTMKRQIKEGEKWVRPLMTRGSENLRKLESLNIDAAMQSRYLSVHARNPVWTNTATEYLPSGEIAFEHIIEALKKAERFIFVEFFIIGEGRMWETILAILAEKAKRGVDVRVMYDDFGCIGRLPSGYEKKLEAMGIKCAVFNLLKPLLSASYNHRDHRKILVIDGRVGFTGGINLADEYINEFPRFGHWKDNAIRLEGDAVASFTSMFLKLWTFARRKHDDDPRYEAFPQDGLPVSESDGFVQPYEDSPLDSELVGENVYLNIIGKAKRYLYITTPYLIIDNEMLMALTLAAKNGLDVRIITPHIPDKWYVHAVTRANYRALIAGGVRIFEYMPGFIHSKTFVADDVFGTVGTINLDFRSLYLHFECGVWLYGCKSLLAMRDDFLATLEKCREVTIAELDAIKIHRKVAGWLLKVFSPLL
ncbi:MAG TPA: cardiolipin synthase [Rectinemataceae bacterium]|nr:cardiolipin synthase [Rectinemataceae bacterium]